MTKQELINAIAAKTGTNKADTLRFVGALEETIRETLIKGEEVPLASTGKFKIKETKARTGRNPKTGESVLIPAKRKVVFLPTKALKDVLI
ncbi:HU family DNA-binding protein [Vogesella sp. AC12]|uniref:HU family DNA-binding protein n=1 Tax=Vogesella sp. AC12 TaxID=2950550 RepID=UPI0021096D73|nr:HU family DNA-binding protein [Vogesella sp. AC12]MCQ4142816.1 HU family DNA-binding protein [Vogesella sp. AC12]